MSALDLLTRGLAQASGLSLVTQGLLVIRELAPEPGIEVGDIRVDVRLRFDVAQLEADARIVRGDLESDNGLETAVLLSLFTDARALPEELARSGAAKEDPRGYWGDPYAEIAGDKFGSKLHLLERAKQTEETRVLAQQYAAESLAWLNVDRITQRVGVEALYPRDRMLGLVIALERQRGPSRFGFVWEI